MIKDTLSRIESAIARIEAGKSKDKTELVALLNKLKSELAALPPERIEEARSLGRFTEAAAHEATRDEASARLKELSIEGVEQAVKGFEATHPTLTGVVNEICMILARMGI